MIELVEAQNLESKNVTQYEEHESEPTTKVTVTILPYLKKWGIYFLYYQNVFLVVVDVMRCNK